MYYAKKQVRAKEVYTKGLTGKGVRIAVLDTGMVPNHPDLKHRAVYFKDFVGDKVQLYDDNGHGTHIAGILCGSGALSNGTNSGMAKNAELIVLKVLDEKGNGNAADAIRALEWIKENYRIFRIRLLNFSVGFRIGNQKPEQRKILELIEELWDLGIMVVAAAGNNGPGKSTVTVPGISKKIVTVGAMGDARMVKYCDEIAKFSGKGPTENCVMKPEVLAPGTQILSTGADGNGYIRKNGTSMATPIVCGAFALALEKNPTLTPEMLKLLLYQSVRPAIGEMKGKCWGILDVDALIRIVP